MRNYRISCEDRSSPQATATIGTAQHAKAQTTRRPALAARTPVDLQRNPPQSLNLQLLPDRIQQNWRQNAHSRDGCAFLSVDRTVRGAYGDRSPPPLVVPWPDR